MEEHITEKAAGKSLLEHLRQHGFPDISLADAEHPVQRLGGGYCRDCFKVATDKGDFVITFFTFNWQRQTVDYINSFVSHLGANDCSIVPPIGPFGKTDKQTAFEVMPFVEGQVEKSPSLFQIERLGTELGKIHKASNSFEYATDSGNANTLRGWVKLGTRHGQKILIGSEYAGTSYFKGNLPDLAKNSVAVFESLLQRKKLPQGVIHGDMNRHNVLWQGDKPVLLDFERTRPSDFLYEVAKAIQEFIVIPSLEKGKSDYKDKVGAFLNAYHTQRPFTDQEMETLPTMLRLHAILAAVKQSAMGMGRRYPALPQGAMLQTETDRLVKTDFKSLLDTPTVPNETYRTATPATARYF